MSAGVCPSCAERARGRVLSCPQPFSTGRVVASPKSQTSCVFPFSSWSQFTNGPVVYPVAAIIWAFVAPWLVFWVGDAPSHTVEVSGSVVVSPMQFWMLTPCIVVPIS